MRELDTRRNYIQERILDTGRNYITRENWIQGETSFRRG